MYLLRSLPTDARIGVGVVNQKCRDTEIPADVATRINRAIELFGVERVLLHPDCGFATFADSPICGSSSAEEKLAVIAEAVERIR